MHLKYLHSSTARVMDRPENAGIETVLAMLDRLRDRGHTVEVVDTSGLSDAKRRATYSHEALPAAGDRYRISRVFASNTRSGAQSFGRENPGLLVSVVQGAPPTAVYPHEAEDGELTTIASFLASLI